jgi:Lon protease-like protein
LGDRKFRVQRVWRATDGLNLGEVTWLPAEPSLVIPAEYSRLSDVVRRAVTELDEHYEHVEKKYDDASWVGSRLAELLPVDPTEKQVLLEIEDPIRRLEALASAVE